jgi:hypothetical protein
MESALTSFDTDSYDAAQVPAPSRPGIQWLALRLLQVQVDGGPRPPGGLAATAMPPPQARCGAGDMAGIRSCAIVYGDRHSSSNKLGGATHHFLRRCLRVLPHDLRSQSHRVPAARPMLHHAIKFGVRFLRIAGLQNHLDDSQVAF